MQESSVVGFLDDHGRFTQSVDVMNELLRDYPPESYLAAATYRLAQRVYAKAPQAAEDPELKKHKINRVDLVRLAAEMMEDFLTANPEDPSADQAAFAKANTLLELDAYEQAVAACSRYATRYPNSSLLDTFWYIIGYCHFAMGQHQAAMDMCRKVADAALVDAETGRKREAKNKWQAIYILGQVYHSLGQAAEAVREYRRVEGRFADAKKSIEYFLRKSIELPEITTVRPGEPVEVDLGFRNIPGCDVKVYRIDLMKFSLVRRNLNQVTQINLAGIRPEHDRSVELGDGLDYRDRTHPLALPLDQEGAYLIVARGDNLHASGLVLVTPLAVEVQYDQAGGQVRATVKNVIEDQYVSDVEVKIIGSGNQDFVTGSTDLRGVFVAEGIRGLPTVVARVDPARYAFHRSPRLAPAGATPSIQPTANWPAVEPLEKFRTGLHGKQRISQNEGRINAALDSPTAFQFIETPLHDVVEYLKRLHRIDIQLDQRALDDVGISSDAPISRTVRGITLRSALRLVLKELDLSYAIQDEVLLVTTPEMLESPEYMSTVVYPVTDLVRFLDKEGQPWSDFQSLIDAIYNNVEPTTWDTVGGPASGSPMTYGDTDVLVLSQTQETQRKIADFLQNLRRAGGAREGKEGDLPVKERLDQRPFTQSGFGFGGMGGGFGGMGGMGGGMGGMGPMNAQGAPFGPGLAAPGQPTPGNQDLLKGLQDANRELQGHETEQLKKMYQQGKGMGGMGAGGFF